MFSHGQAHEKTINIFTGKKQGKKKSCTQKKPMIEK